MKALIVDDEPMAAKYLQTLVEQHCFEITSTHLIFSPIDALAHLKEVAYDIVFLDVEMPELDGVALLEKAQLPVATQVIFTTAHSSYAIDAFKANATHYLLKPINKEELTMAMRKAMRLMNLNKPLPNENTPQNDNGVISIFHEEEHHIIKISDILRFEADGSYTKIVLEKTKYYSSKGIGYFEKKVEGTSFYRCHNSHLLNLQKVVRMGKGKGSYAVLNNNDTVPISTTKKEEFEKRMGL